MNQSIIYLSGAIRAELAGDPRFGYLMTPNMGNRAPQTTWAADTGCFTAKGINHFSFEGYLGWLRNRPASSCLFATAPDVLGDAAATIARSLPALPAIGELGYRRAFVGQDGLENLEVPWSEFDCLFLGGSTEWKLSLGAAELAHEAKTRGKWVHMGRVNSYRRLQYAASLGCDSADGTFLKFAPQENYGRLCGWFDKLALVSRSDNHYNYQLN
jgi:hypothetical protein